MEHVSRPAKRLLEDRLDDIVEELMDLPDSPKRRELEGRAHDIEDLLMELS